MQNDHKVGIPCGNVIPVAGISVEVLEIVFKV